MAGLGNQMFQYASGLALAERHQTVLKIGINSYKQSDWTREQHERYSLSCFNITEQFATDEELNRVRGRHFNRMERPICKLARAVGASRFIKRYANTGNWAKIDPRNVDPRFDNIPDNTYLDGFCHSEKYFANVTDILRLHFSFRYPMPPAVTSLSDRIKSRPSIAVHFRRGDYQTNENAARNIGALPLAYYHRAMQIMRERFPDAVFYVFSDDIEAVSGEILPPGPHEFVRCVEDWHAYDVIRLISQCEHAIIANSTFSWWGAWLIPSPDKLVIAPNPWCAHPDRIFNLAPESWMKVPRNG